MESDATRADGDLVREIRGDDENVAEFAESEPEEPAAAVEAPKKRAPRKAAPKKKSAGG